MEEKYCPCRNGRLWFRCVRFAADFFRGGRARASWAGNSLSTPRDGPPSPPMRGRSQPDLLFKPDAWRSSLASMSPCEAVRADDDALAFGRHQRALRDAAAHSAADCGDLIR